MGFSFNNLLTQKAIQRTPGLTSTEKWVAVAALSFRNARTGVCAPPIESRPGAPASDDKDGEAREDLVTATSLTRTCIKKTLASLESKGVIRLTRKSARPSQIDFLVDAAATDDETDSPVTTLPVTELPAASLPVTTLPVTTLPVTTLPLPVTTLPVPVTTLPQTNKKQINNKDSVSAYAESAELFPSQEENGTGFPPAPEESPAFDLKAETEPAKAVKPKRETAKRLAASLQKPEGVPVELWEEWVAFKKKRCKACTPRMVKHLCEEAEKAGLTPEGAMTVQLERGWAGFEASYMRDAEIPAGFQTRKPEPQLRYDPAFYVQEPRQKPRKAESAEDEDPHVLQLIRAHLNGRAVF